MENARTICRLAVTVAVVLSTTTALHAQTYPTGNDPRNGLKPGMLDAGTAQGASIVTIAFWIGPAGQPPVNVSRRPSYDTSLSSSTRHTMSGSSRS